MAYFLFRVFAVCCFGSRRVEYRALKVRKLCSELSCEISEELDLLERFTLPEYDRYKGRYFLCVWSQFSPINIFLEVVSSKDKF
jgi:hypothetical protein